MNSYLVSFIEIVLFGTIAYFLGNNIDLYTEDDTLVNLNYMFWVYLISLSVLINFGLYIHFVSVFVIGLLFIGIYIYKIVRVITFVDLDMTMYFWMLFGIFFIPLLVLLITKGILISAYRSDAPRGIIGERGEVGEVGDSYFIESLSDKAYVLIINGIEDYLKEIYDMNEVQYDPYEKLLKNYYLKENIKRITSSKSFIDRLIGTYGGGPNNKECALPNDSCSNSSNRYCFDKMDINRYGPSQSSPVNQGLISCHIDSDCNSNTLSLDIHNLSIQRPDNADSNNPLYQLFIRVKYWIRLILENTCEDDTKVKKKLKIPNYSVMPTIKSDFKVYQNTNENGISDRNVNDYHKEDFLNINKINYYRMNSLLGRKFIAGDFLNHRFWENNINKTNPFETIHTDEKWLWGLSSESNIDISNPTSQCVSLNLLQHPML